MKTYLPSRLLYEDGARALTTALSKRGVQINSYRAETAFAAILGFSSFWSATSEAKYQKRSPYDSEMEPRAFERRRLSQIKSLSDNLSLDDSVSAQIIDEIRPTAERVISPPTIDIADDLRTRVIEIIKSSTSKHRSHRQILIDHITRTFTVSGFREGLDLTVDQFLSERVPKIARDFRAVYPGNPTGTPITEIWLRSSQFSTGWEMLAELIGKTFRIPEFREHDFEPTEGGYRWTDFAKEIGVDESTLLYSVARLPLRPELANEAIQKLRLEMGSVPVKNLIVRSRNKWGFHEWFPGIENSDLPEAEYWRPIKGEPKPADVRKCECTFQGTRIEINLTRERCHYDYEEGPKPLAFYFVTVTASMKDEVVGVIRGELISNRMPSYGIANSWFYEHAESISGDLTHLAHIILNKHMSADDLFDAGDLFYLSYWEVIPSYRKTGFAAGFLSTVIKEMKRRHKRLESIAFENRPVQFPHPFDRRLPKAIVESYDRSRQKLGNRIRHLASDCGLIGYSIEFEVTPEQEGLTDMERFTQHVVREMHHR